MKIQSLMNLKGRRAIVTGATGGLGTVIAETLAELGSDLILVDLEKNEIESMQHRLAETFGVSVVGTVCDLENQDQRQDQRHQLQDDRDRKSPVPIGQSEAPAPSRALHLSKGVTPADGM